MSVGFSRRAFLVSGASLAGVGWAGVLTARVAAAPALTTLRNLALRRSAFLPLRGQTFLIAHDRGSLSVVLHQVSDLKPTAWSGAEDQFSLIFTGSGLWHRAVPCVIVMMQRIAEVAAYVAKERLR